MVVAGPGTGKTSTLVERMSTLLTEDQSREVSFITFTRTSRRDTHSRLEKEFGEAVFDDPHLIFPRTSTLHAYAKSLLHKYAQTIGRRSDFSVLIENKDEKGLLISELVEDLALNIGIQKLSEGIYCYRCTGEWPNPFQLSSSDRIAVLKHFETLLAFYNTFDMEGMVANACGILDSAVRKLPQLFLQVDEYQDLNPIDQRLVQLLVTSHPLSQVVVVGDDAQSIYGSLRHANFQGLRDLWESPDWDRESFPDSQRLPAHILNAALDLVATEGYIDAALNRKPPNGKRISTLQCTRSDFQVQAVANHIKQTMASPKLEGQPPLRYKDFLVLCPTTAFVDNTVQQLSKRHIPTHKPTASFVPESYWKLLLLLRIAHSQDPLALRQWLPFLSIKQDEILTLRRNAMNSEVGFYAFCHSQEDPRLQHLFQQLRQLTQSTTDLASFESALQAFDGLPPQDEFFEYLASQSSGEPLTVPSLGRLIQLIYEKFGLIDTDDVIADEDKVLVCTLHSAKGLEAEYVYCMWMNAKFMPMPNRDTAEQRRVLYVALTRAKQDVVLTFHEEYDRSIPRLLSEQAMSPFLHEIREHLNLTRVNSKDLR